jgi:hypothetical protein
LFLFSYTVPDSLNQQHSFWQPLSPTATASVHAKEGKASSDSKEKAKDTNDGVVE